MIRILAFSDWRVQKISDIFNFIEHLEDPIDFILYGGDDVGRFEDEGVNYFTNLSRYTRQNKVLAVVGNDDFPEVKKVLESKNVHNLHEKPFIFQDLCIHLFSSFPSLSLTLLSFHSLVIQLSSPRLRN